MIRVVITLHPGGNLDEGLHLGTMEISNTVTETLETEGRRGAYRYRYWKKRMGGKPVREDYIFGYPRNAYSVWELLRRILNQERPYL